MSEPRRSSRGFPLRVGARVSVRKLVFGADCVGSKSRSTPTSEGSTLAGIRLSRQRQLVHAA
eukprot:5119499-Prymnesium_polylepis.1